MCVKVCLNIAPHQVHMHKQQVVQSLRARRDMIQGQRSCCCTCSNQRDGALQASHHAKAVLRC